MACVGDHGPKIAIVDDDPAIRDLLGEYLKTKGFRIECFAQAEDFLKAIYRDDAKGFSLIVSDILLPGMHGLKFVERLKRTLPGLPIILMTADTGVEHAIQALREGVYDYFQKPFELAKLETTIRRALRSQHLETENAVLRERLSSSTGLEGIIGKSPSIKGICELVRRVARTDANILITGESGTGKEVIARAIHQLSSRHVKSFVAINCSAIPGNLLESELFGHAKGSFTGALSDRKGLFEEGSGGTVFLDEIGEMEIGLQVKLLRVLQEKRIKPVGVNQSRAVDVRIIAATNRNLWKEMKGGRFREDLYFRLRVIPIDIPPLRKRREDIPALAQHFLRKYSSVHNSQVKGFDPEAMKKLCQMRWSGNVRELENAVERAIIFSTGEQILPEAIPSPEFEESPQDVLSEIASDLPSLKEMESRYIDWVLSQHSGRKNQAAEILGLSKRSLYRRVGTPEAWKRRP